MPNENENKNCIFGVSLERICGVDIDGKFQYNGCFDTVDTRRAMIEFRKLNSLDKITNPLCFHAFMGRTVTLFSS